MKPTIEYINELIRNKIQENTSLEYKRAEAIDKADKKIEALSISVSSFANSNGGRLILGIKEFDEKEKRHLPEKITPIDVTKFPKEWLEQVINDNIYPRISNLKITPIEINESQYVFVIDIPQSDTAHQAKDFKYYKRHIFRKLPMQDYEVRDVFNRNKYPKFECKAFFYITETKESDHFMSMPTFSMSGLKEEPKIKKEIFLCLSAENIGKKTAKYCKGEFLFPSKYINPKDELKWKNTRNIDQEEYVIIEANNKKRELIDSEMIGMTFKGKYSPSVFEPVIPRSNIELCSHKVTDKVLDENFKIYWEILVDEAEPTNGKTDSESIEREYKKY